jgi:hypothetical protein
VESEAPLISGGWEIATGFAASAPQQRSRRFYAVYEGSAFGHPERGLIAALAHGHESQSSAGSGEEWGTVPGAKGANEAAQLVVHSFAEGYFGARRTLGTKRAAHLALTSINDWLYGQTVNGSSRHLAPVSLTAMLFHGNAVGVVHVGSGRLYRWRAGVVTPLMRDDRRTIQGGKAELTRGIGLDLEISVDFEELEAKQGDRFLLVSGLDALAPETIQAAFDLELPPDGDASAIVLDVVAAPTAGQPAKQGDLKDLPLRPAPREGDVLDGFVIGKTLYRGRYTILKIARDTIEDRQVVLKIPLPSMLQDEIFSAGFMREAWIGSTVRGTNVARYIELPPERRSSLYLVMPYYHGETLEARLIRPPPISLPDGVGIALKLCEAVQDLAAIEIVHRDLKPDNIMLLANNEVKLLDLGLAYLPGIDLRDVAKPGGTLRYMAPELLRGTQANARSEVYSLAVTIYRMFSGGAYPYGQREGLPLARLRPDLPRWLGKALQTGLAPEPSERFADAGEMAKVLYDGLVSGAADAPRPRRFHLTKLQAWKAATAIFAIGFFVLLILLLR